MREVSGNHICFSLVGIPIFNSQYLFIYSSIEGAHVLSHWYAFSSCLGNLCLFLWRVSCCTTIQWYTWCQCSRFFWFTYWRYTFLVWEISSTHKLKESLWNSRTNKKNTCMYKRISLKCVHVSIGYRSIYEYFQSMSSKSKCKLESFINFHWNILVHANNLTCRFANSLLQR